MINRTLITCWLLLSVFMFSAIMSPAWAQTITAIDYKVEGGQGRLNLSFDQPLQAGDASVFTIKGDKPRIVIDLKSGNMAKALTAKTANNTMPINKSGIRQIRFGLQKNGVFRLVADLDNGSALKDHKIRSGALDIVITGTNFPKASQLASASPIKDSSIAYPRLKPGLSAKATPLSAQNSSPRKFAGMPYPRLKPLLPQGLKASIRSLPVIVIDPGHGGYDPGAIGQAKVKEEYVTLSAALELKKQLLATGRYKVVLTREKDVYIAHEQRVRIAREAGADLFISIHADSTKGHTARGASVYTLADRAQKRASSIISSQNWILDVDLADQSEQVGDILVDLAQRKTLSKSAQFAEILIPELAKKTKLIGNSHRRAGYYVLLAPDVPAVLLEMGFLSNAQDEKLLNTSSHRKKLMQSVTTAINMYFDTQTPLHAMR